MLENPLTGSGAPADVIDSGVESWLRWKGAKAAALAKTRIV